MTRSILCGLLGLISVVTLGTLPVACQSGGVGDPCTPEDEYNPQFAGFKVSEENIESRSFQCSTRICLVNHFQGRVSCPLGQPAPGDPGSAIKECDPTNPAACEAGSACTETASLAPDCTKDTDCAGIQGTTCDTKRKLCVCASGGFTVGTVTYYCNADHVYTAYVCHKTEGNCQTGANPGDTPKTIFDRNNGKVCCIPGTNTPVISPVCGQCADNSNRNAGQAVYCSCRCGVAEGQVDDGSFNFCECPTGFSCTEIRKDVGLGDKQITGKYCIKENTEFLGDAFTCGQVQGQWDATCKGTAATSAPSGS